MTKGKKKPERIALDERLRRTVAAGCGDLSPGGRLPQGLTPEKATRAMLGLVTLSMERFADAAEKMLAILEETEPDDWPEDEDGDPARAEPARHPHAPDLPVMPRSPQEMIKLVEDQDRETCRAFAVEFVLWLMAHVEKKGGIMWDMEELHDLHRDLAAQEVSALDVVAECYQRSRADVEFRDMDKEPKPGEVGVELPSQDDQEGGEDDTSGE
jgi:hypothetical protein